MKERVFCVGYRICGRVMAGLKMSAVPGCAYDPADLRSRAAQLKAAALAVLRMRRAKAAASSAGRTAREERLRAERDACAEQLALALKEIETLRSRLRIVTAASFVVVRRWQPSRPASAG